MTSLPKRYKKYFWDCDFNELTLEKYTFFISERILNYGNKESVKWLLNHISLELLNNVVSRSKNLDKKTRNYWQLILYE
jgi:hypothetical protein